LIALYFNCRISSKQLIPNSKSSGYFYPIVYPQEDVIFNKHSQYEILLHTLASYSKVEYSHAIFNIEIDGVSLSIKEEIEALVKGNFRANTIKINYCRPSSREAWIDDINKVGPGIGLDNPVLIVMNHDHPFVDYTDKIFDDVVKSIFFDTDTNFCKALYYSHAPETISWALNGKIGTLFERKDQFIYESQPVHNWLDGYSVMTMATLKHIFHNANCSSEYMGRFDWPGVKYGNLNLRTFVYPREFFRHFDGYGHITGIRLFSSCELRGSPKDLNIANMSQDEIICFYYQKWLDCFLLMVRDSVQSKSYFQSERNVFISAIEVSLEVFWNTYIKKDVACQLTHESNIEVILLGLKNKIFFNANELFQKITVDIKLNRLSTISKFRSQLVVNKFIINLKFILSR
jgi:hypothetical protein